MGKLRFAMLGVVTLASLGVPGCGTVLGLNDYEIDSCWTPNDAASGKPCFKCTPRTHDELLNACTLSACFPFTNEDRIKDFDGDLPPQPAGAREFGHVPSSSTLVADRKCSTLTDAVYISGSTALEHTFQRLFTEVLPGVPVVFYAMPSCDGVRAMALSLEKGRVARYFPGTEGAGCEIDEDHIPDIVLSDVPANSCGVQVPADFLPLKGPIQLFMFAVRSDSAQEAISREAAFLTFGYPETNRVAPWIVPTNVFRRHESSGTQRVIGDVVGLDFDKFSGVRVDSSRAILAELAKSDREAGIAITSPDQLLKNADVRALAYQHAGQNCAFLPDVNRNSSDKRNVRDGHYALWAPIQVFMRTAGKRSTHTETVARMFDGFLDAKPRRTFFEILKQGSLVPRCAMRVDRDGPREPIRPFRAELSCACAFENAIPASTDVTQSCRPCSPDGSSCGGGRICENGFCEPT